MRTKARWTRRARLSLVERLEMYAAAGMPIIEALKQAGEGLPLRLCGSLRRAADRAASGQTLSMSLVSETGLPPAVAGLLACGESSGGLAQALRSSRLLLEREDELQKKCLSAMTYPLVIGLAAVALMVGLTQGIMPQITPLLTGLRTDLPILTRVVMGSSRLMMSHGLYIGIGCVAVPVIAMVAYRRSLRIRAVAHVCLIRMPIIGSLARRYALAIFFQSFGSLVESGMPSDTAYARASSAIPVIPIRRMLLSRAESISHGGRVNAALREGLPGYISPLISAGEASGSLPAALLKAASILDRELEHSLKRLTALIEPAMMVGTGAMVGAIALSIMMPIYDISKTLQQ